MFILLAKNGNVNRQTIGSGFVTLDQAISAAKATLVSNQNMAAVDICEEHTKVSRTIDVLLTPIK